MEIKVVYTYANIHTSGKKVVMFHDQQDYSSLTDYVDRVAERAMESDTELVLNATCDGHWLLTQIAYHGTSQSLFAMNDGIHHCVK